MSEETRWYTELILTKHHFSTVTDFYKEQQIPLEPDLSALKTRVLDETYSLTLEDQVLTAKRVFALIAKRAYPVFKSPAFDAIALECANKLESYPLPGPDKTP